MDPINKHTVHRWIDGSRVETTEEVAEELAVALIYNGISHAVMLATPHDLVDFAYGFSMSENIVGTPDQIFAVNTVSDPRGIELHIDIAGARFNELKKRRRNLAGRTGCGLCGAESLEAVMRPSQAVTARIPIDDKAIQRARMNFTRAQPLQARTGAMHGAAWCDRAGEVEVIREDVGRHNALDKLLGALAQSGFRPDEGFVFLSSRLSYEMVQKVAVFNIATLAAVSAPTRLAIEVAEHSGIL